MPKNSLRQYFTIKYGVDLVSIGMISEEKHVMDGGHHLNPTPKE